MSNCARHRFVAASSRRTDEKVASRRGSGRHCLSASLARALSLSLEGVNVSKEGRECDGLMDEKGANVPKEAPDHVFQ